MCTWCVDYRALVKSFYYSSKSICRYGSLENFVFNFEKMNIKSNLEITFKLRSFRFVHFIQPSSFVSRLPQMQIRTLFWRNYKFAGHTQKRNMYVYKCRVYVNFCDPPGEVLAESHPFLSPVRRRQKDIG